MHDYKDLYARLTHDKENRFCTVKYVVSEHRVLYQPAQAHMHDHLTATSEQDEIDERLEKALIARLKKVFAFLSRLSSRTHASPTS